MLGRASMTSGIHLQYTVSRNFLKKGRGPAEVLPILSTYMGHKTYKGTSKYLHLTSELYPEILEKMEAAFGGLLPERMEADEQTD